VVTTQSQLPDPDDTIVALSSAAGPALRAIVRLSGRQAPAIATAVCPGFEPSQTPTGQFFPGGLRLAGFQSPIPADIYAFVAPRTYTGQDVIEIHTISCPPILDVLIAQCLGAGARSAQPGEFTMRAFLAGKLDLTRAEAVLGVIDATDRNELKHALAQLAGGLANPLRELRDDLLNLLADVEAGLDFAEEDIHFISTEVLLKRIAKGLAYLTLMRKQIEQRSLGQRRCRVVLMGKPNAGKSSLFNALVGQTAALVSAEPGTTRDYLEKTLNLDGMAVCLVDTAGSGAAQDAIDASAQQLGTQQLRQADLVLWCWACDDPHDAEPPPDALCIATKADCGPAPAAWLATSAITGAGLDVLRLQLAQRVRAIGHAALAPSLSRCRHHVDTCLEYLRRAHSLVLNEQAPELLALELRLTLDELGAMVGAVFTDDLLDRIFSRFCIGK
jgi:tRNA modification GTPase